MVEESTNKTEIKSMKPKKKTCLFCDDKSVPSYTDSAKLRRFTTDRGKIVSKQRSGVCAKHQRRLSVEIKRGRHLAILPFAVGVR